MSSGSSVFDPDPDPDPEGMGEGERRGPIPIPKDNAPGMLRPSKHDWNVVFGIVGVPIML